MQPHATQCSEHSGLDIIRTNRKADIITPPYTETLADSYGRDARTLDIVPLNHTKDSSNTT